jgi:transposase
MPKELHINDVLWMAGILEGEGYFGYTGKSPRCNLHMTDEDTIQKFSNLIEQKYKLIKHKNPKWKNAFKISLTSSKAIELMNIILPYMGKRRSEKIKEVLKIYETKKRKCHNDVELEYLIELKQTQSYRKIAKLYGVTHRAIMDWIKNEKIPKDKKYFKLINDDSYDKIYYIAGLLEGEGSFLKSPPSEKKSPRISIMMTDEDIISNYSNYFNVNYSSWQNKKKDENGNFKYKKVYISIIKGNYAIEIMKEIQCLMSKRRKIQITEAINSFNPRLKIESDYKKRKITNEQLDEIKKHLENNLSLREIAKMYDVSKNTIRNSKKYFKY